ncbi:MAG: hypothetical protein GYA36_18925 [Veillonellaceae bacterium]|nr:hypothetical protein [Veillonellaceae bacterium]
MKSLEITTEWIFGTFPISFHADGNGTMTITTDSFSDSKWIELALDSIHICYKAYEIEDDESEVIEMCWEFRLEAIKNDCPNLYYDWLIMDMHNSSYNRKN